MEETIRFYKTSNPADEVKIFQSKMPPVPDKAAREEAYQKLPALVVKQQIQNNEIKETLRRLISPVLKLYAREGVYDLIVFQYKMPVIFSASGVLLVVSTGLIENAASDDEILGFVAHELGHEYYAAYDDYSKYLLKLVRENGKEPALDRKLSEARGIIELQCDAFAAVTVFFLNYNSISYIEGLERMTRNFPTAETDYHPTDAARRKLVEQITPKENLSVKPKVSDELKELKKLIAALEK